MMGDGWTQGRKEKREEVCIEGKEAQCMAGKERRGLIVYVRERKKIRRGEMNTGEGMDTSRKGRKVCGEGKEAQRMAGKENKEYYKKESNEN